MFNPSLTPAFVTNIAKIAKNIKFQPLPKLKLSFIISFFSILNSPCQTSFINCFSVTLCVIFITFDRVVGKIDASILYILNYDIHNIQNISASLQTVFFRLEREISESANKDVRRKTLAEYLHHKKLHKKCGQQHGRIYLYNF